MKVALVHAVPTRHAQHFAWKWRAEDGVQSSTEAFEYFFECCEDARKAGFYCKFVRVAADAPSKVRRAREAHAQ